MTRETYQVPALIEVAVARRRQPRASLPVELTIHTLDRLVLDLVPFYGWDCPIAVVSHDAGTKKQIMQGTLATIQSGIEMNRSSKPLFALVG
jgi:precorrin-4/cobalt-precorrin-4 C11-methyltransferase